MTVEILCTLGPASMNDRTISRLEHLGVALFRVNLSHTRLEDVEPVIRFIQERTRVPVCIDTEGAQIRTAALVDGHVTLREGSTVTLHSTLVPGDPYNIGLYPADSVTLLEAGDFISIDFNAVLTQVVEVGGGCAKVRVINGGEIGSNKAITVHRPIRLPALTAKDLAAIAVGRKLGICHVALSFANRAEDVDEIRAHAGAGTQVISKIECRNGLENLRAIAERSDAILIDRGDLSREIPIEAIPATQKKIIRVVKEVGRKVYVATNLLETMVASPVPTRAEVNDIYNTIADGADGLVLAAETAIGKYPINCATMVVRLVGEYVRGDCPSALAEPFSLLPEPHGGRLNIADASAADVADLANLTKVEVSNRGLRDAEQIALGVYSPVSGFMDPEALESVLRQSRLPDGTVWTMPIVLQWPTGTREPGHGQRVALADEAGTVRSLLDVDQTFTVHLESLAKQWFGTDSRDHPGVERLLAGGARFVAGAVRLVAKLPSPNRAHELTPRQCRFIFSHKGWTRVVAFHGRNAPHRAHEFIQVTALERVHADGLLISPVIGPRKPGDFLPEAIIKSYEALIGFGLYPEGKVVLGCFASYPRYSGPREAVFTALCRKNMGCSHFIVGRDHTGVGNFYGPEENRCLFESLGDIGIEPVFFDAIGFDPRLGRYVELRECPDAHPISGSDIRRALLAGEVLPEWKVRSIVQDVLRGELERGRNLFAQ